ncbi:Nucleosome assembly protein 1-like 4 [Linum grandiflorum]
MADQGARNEVDAVVDQLEELKLQRLEGLEASASNDCNEKLLNLEELDPNVRVSVEKLLEMQRQQDEIEAEFRKEKAELLAKYRINCEPLYAQRHQIVHEEGVSDFWLNTMKNHAVLTEEISDRDEAALISLKEIKCTYHDDQMKNPGFKLEFFFYDNPYFSNSVLTKIYNLTYEYDLHSDPVLESATGTEIEWYQGKCLTQKTAVRRRNGEGPKTVTEDCESFFNFFKTPYIPKDDEEELDDDGEGKLERDYDIACFIKDTIVPHAVSWFTGEAGIRDRDDWLDDDDDEEDNDNANEEQEEEEEEVDNEEEEDEVIKESDEEVSHQQQVIRKKAKLYNNNNMASKEVDAVGNQLKLQSLEGLDPVVRDRVERLREIESHHDEFDSKLFREMNELESEYQIKYKPLYIRRDNIINGREAASSEVATVPNFWLVAMKNNRMLSKKITAKDERALMLLKDIKYSKLVDEENRHDSNKGFRLDFEFDPNPYFKDSVLSKTYHMSYEPSDYNEPLVERAVGTEIKWYTEKEDSGSFFDFFSPRQIPHNYEDLDEEGAYDLQTDMERDYDMGCTFRDKIIPHAVSWYTGEAAVWDEDNSDEEEDNNNVNEEQEQEEEEEEEEEGDIDDGDEEGNNNATEEQEQEEEEGDDEEAEEKEDDDEDEVIKDMKESAAEIN